MSTLMGKQEDTISMPQWYGCKQLTVVVVTLRLKASPCLLSIHSVQ